MNPMPSSKPTLGMTTRDYGESFVENILALASDESQNLRQEFFEAVATHLVKHIAPRTALDVGCAKGYLVDALVQEGVDAYGIATSDSAVDDAATEVRDRLTVGDITEPLDGFWDLVICIGVLERMGQVEAQRALDHITAVTDLVLFASSPRLYDEPAYINVHPQADWAEWFALRGFFRRTDVDVSGLSRWATLYERRQLSAPSVVHLYETELTPLREEVQDKRQALLAKQRQLDELKSEQGDEQEPLVDTSVERVLRLTDQVLGLQAELGQLRYAYERFTREAEVRLEEERNRRRFLAPQIAESTEIVRSRLRTERQLRQTLARRLSEETARSGEAQRRLEAVLATQDTPSAQPDTPSAALRAVTLLRRIGASASVVRARARTRLG